MNKNFQVSTYILSFVLKYYSGTPGNMYTEVIIRHYISEMANLQLSVMVVDEACVLFIKSKFICD